jgi:hypothetical protein
MSNCDCQENFVNRGRLFNFSPRSDVRNIDRMPQEFAEQDASQNGAKAVLIAS